jgi:outer membrane lipase/esterase
MPQISKLTKAFALAGCALGALLSVTAAVAGPYTAEYVFGDSLSDNGNLAAFLRTPFPNPPSFHDSFTNGPVAVDVLAQSLGLPLNPSLWLTGTTGPGTNYAVAGATSVSPPPSPTTPPINLLDQVGAFSAHVGNVADPSALYVVMIGGNDVRNAVLPGGGGLPAVQAGVKAELGAIAALSAEDAKNFLIVNVPNVGLIPEFAQDNPTLAAAATSDSVSYDNMLAAGLATLDPTLPAGTSLDEFNLFAFNTTLLANAMSLGFTNTKDRCYTKTPFSAATSAACGPNAENIDSLVYWDDIHPTARVQAFWAQGMGAELGVIVAIPEPSTWATMLIGFAALGLAGYRSSRKGRATPLAA